MPIACTSHAHRMHVTCSSYAHHVLVTWSSHDPQDYPSVSMVAKKMLDESIFPIFGVVTNRGDEEQLVYQTYRVS